MARQGFVSHVAEGYTTAERYDRYQLEERCRVVDDTNTGVRDDQELETVAKSVAGRPYDDDGTTRINREERDVALAVIEGWFDETEPRRKLLLENADEIGLGVVVQSDGDVWVTADLC